MEENNTEFFFGSIIFIVLLLFHILALAVVTPVTASQSSPNYHLQFGPRVILEGILGIVFLILGLFVFKKKVFFYPFVLNSILLMAGSSTLYFGRAYFLLFLPNISKTEIYDLVRLGLIIIFGIILFYYVNKNVFEKKQVNQMQ